MGRLAQPAEGAWRADQPQPQRRPLAAAIAESQEAPAAQRPTEWPPAASGLTARPRLPPLPEPLTGRSRTLMASASAAFGTTRNSRDLGGVLSGSVDSSASCGVWIALGLHETCGGPRRTCNRSCAGALGVYDAGVDRSRATAAAARSEAGSRDNRSIAARGIEPEGRTRRRCRCAKVALEGANGASRCAKAWCVLQGPAVQPGRR
jgi:hypothetical protein